MPVFAAEEEQRLTAHNFGFVDLRDKNRVIPGNVLGDNAATQLQRSVLENGNASLRPAVLNGQSFLSFAVLHALREIFGDGLLVLFQDADAEFFSLMEQWQDLRFFVHANKDQHGLQ